MSSLSLFLFIIVRGWGVFVSEFEAADSSNLCHETDRLAWCMVTSSWVQFVSMMVSIPIHWQNLMHPLPSAYHYLQGYGLPLFLSGKKKVSGFCCPMLMYSMCPWVRRGVVRQCGWYTKFIRCCVCVMCFCFFVIALLMYCSVIVVWHIIYIILWCSLSGVCVCVF